MGQYENIKLLIFYLIMGGIKSSQNDDDIITIFIE
jgi:hypothetical protein